MPRRRKTTDIEKKVGSWLRENGLKFKREFRIDYFPVDFYLPEEKLVIQTDGCYWHFTQCDCNKGKIPSTRQKTQIVKDKSCNGVLFARGLKVVRLPGCQVIKNWDQCEIKILNALKR